MAVEPGKELIWKYLSGLCSASEIAFVENWINYSIENKKEFERIQFYLNSIESKNESNKPEETKEKFEEERSFMKNYSLAIALLILVFGLLILFYFLKNN